MNVEDWSSVELQLFIDPTKGVTEPSFDEDGTWENPKNTIHMMTRVVEQIAGKTSGKSDVSRLANHSFVAFSVGGRPVIRVVRPTSPGLKIPKPDEYDSLTRILDAWNFADSTDFLSLVEYTLNPVHQES